MADQVEVLKQLQALDGQIYQLRRQQEQKPLELERVADEVATQEAKAKAAETKVTRLQLSQKEKEVELQTREANVKKLQGQLFQVKTNKEYTAMQREIDTLKADNSLLEETILKTFDAIDQAGKERQEEQRRLAEARKRLEAERQRIDRELAAISEQLAQLERTRTTLLPDVPPDALSTYERILELRDGLAMVPVVNESCGGCDRRLPPQVINRVYLKAELITCEHCNRILYSDETHSKL